MEQYSASFSRAWTSRLRNSAKEMGALPFDEAYGAVIALDTLAAMPVSGLGRTAALEATTWSVRLFFLLLALLLESSDIIIMSSISTGVHEPVVPPPPLVLVSGGRCKGICAAVVDTV